MSSAEIYNLQDIQKSVEFLRTLELKNFTLLDVEEKFCLNDEQIDRLRLCTKLLINIIENLALLDQHDFQIRINQLQSVTKLIDFIRQAGHGDRVGYFHQPTGSGKTVLMSLVAKLLGVKTLVLVPKTYLLTQNKEEFLKYGFFAEEDIGLVGGGNYQIGKNITICTYQSLSKLVQEENKAANGFELVMCDEAHKGLGPSTMETMEALVNEEDQE